VSENPTSPLSCGLCSTYWYATVRTYSSSSNDNNFSRFAQRVCNQLQLLAGAWPDLYGWHGSGVPDFFPLFKYIILTLAVQNSSVLPLYQIRRLCARGPGGGFRRVSIASKTSGLQHIIAGNVERE
jgi:hypothetical protein